MPLGESDAVAQVHHPLPRREPRGDVVGVGDGRRGQVHGCGPGRIGGAHVRVVGGHVLQSRQQLGDEGVHLHRESRIGRLLLADRGRLPVGLGGRAEAAESVRRQHLGLIGQGVREAVGGGVLGAGQLLGEPRLHEIGPPHRTDEEGTAGERGDGPARLAQHVRRVVRRMPGCRHRGQDQFRVDDDGVAVGHGGTSERDVRAGRNVVGGSGDAGQLKTAGHVVVVDVRLDHMGYRHTTPGRSGQHPVDVTGRIHDDRRPTAAGEVAAVTQALQLDGFNEEHGKSPSDGKITPGGMSFTVTLLPPGVYSEARRGLRTGLAIGRPPRERAARQGVLAAQAS